MQLLQLEVELKKGLIHKDYLSNLDINRKNTIEIRAYLFKKSIITTNETDKAKNLALLWKKAEEVGLIVKDFSVSGASLETVFLSMTSKK